MGKNSIKNNKRGIVNQKNKGLLLAFKILIVIAFITVVVCTVIYFMEIGKETRSYFSLHFALPIVLLFVGIIAIMLSFLSMLSISGENKGDKLMIFVGLLLILFAIITLVSSYVNS
ncbi:MAG: hypothetical protein NC310_07295 [Roseburia sp.]|nr:hypothetical protein [Anaeroplasma bactoclasticum]MCM1196854.1 hypothetical protein [Roseburia sp.]MCM1557023.1 hypothetical protein [Anaeroplasma bactoclasticum]